MLLYGKIYKSKDNGDFVSYDVKETLFFVNAANQL